MRTTHYFKALDILRFFAATLVLLAHAHFHLSQLGIAWHNQAKIMYMGRWAVLFFFCLSGFLLALRGIQELAVTHTFNIRTFYYRRILRIWPLYYLTVLLSLLLLVLLFPLLYPSFRATVPMPVSLVCLLLIIPNFLSANRVTNLGAINNLWSIGVEEMFYLLFPFLLLYCKKVKHYILVFAVALLVYLLLYTALIYSKAILPAMLKRFLLTYVFHFMLVGAVAGALWVKCRDHAAAMRWCYAGCLLLGAGIIFAMSVGVMPGSVPGDVMLAILFAIIILFAAGINNKILEKNPLVYFGKISYGIYLFHPFVSYFLRLLYLRSVFFSGIVRQFPAIYFISLVLLTLPVAHLSYRFFEQRFLKLKNRAAAAPL